MSDQYIKGVLEHKSFVAHYIERSIQELFRRSIRHDNSKLLSEESVIYEQVTPKLALVDYGSDEYKELVKELGPALQHHYQVNSHHPEHYKNGINDMDLFDILEMVCDWLAASKRSGSGDMNTIMQINKDRFGIDEQLFQIIVRTIEQLG